MVGRFCIAGALLLVAPALPAAGGIYGVAAHVTLCEGDEYRLKNTIAAVDFAGMKYVRSNFSWDGIVRPGGGFDFSRYDRIVDALEARGITLLPIIFGYDSTRKVPPKDIDLAKYGAYVKAIVSHYGKRLPVVEIWNEENLQGFFPGTDPAVYAKILACAYKAVKSVDPSIRVGFGGLAGISESSVEFFRQVCKAGAADSFDILCVHPYSHPFPPERNLLDGMKRLRAAMKECAVSDRAVWFTEIGWSTPRPSVDQLDVILAGMKVARPKQKTWRVVFASDKTAGPVDATAAIAMLPHLPEGSVVDVCTQPETCRRIAAGDVDAVVYPHDETYPVDTIAAVRDFIGKGGVFIDCGGVPCFKPRRDGNSVKDVGNGRDLGKMPFCCEWASGKNGYPASARCSVTPAGSAAGLKMPGKGFSSQRFLVPKRLGKDAEWIPLVSGKAENGREFVAAAVIKYGGESGGAAVLSSMFFRPGWHSAVTEEQQAKYTARAMGIAFASGVEAYFAYHLRSFETDDDQSEDHLGLMHSNFAPKPAYSAYMSFVKGRPSGSVQKPGEWLDEERGLYFPQWTLPDGRDSGMIWSERGTASVIVRARKGVPAFRNVSGRLVAADETMPGVFRLDVSDSPVYFTGSGISLER